MQNENISTITVTGANNEVREFITDCSLVIAHKLNSDEFNMSLNLSADGATAFMLVTALDQAKRQILDSDPDLKALYEYAQAHGEE